ncbi:MAG: type II toxin-antitoxin system HipA family toxin [bacterium]|nr:type II toxin-antitoxin system HipA family toxin [bacterium]MDI1335878.1 type II toxin-antitoxin system HipA family toxin [Lacunisphaera sp.]
MKRVLQVHLGRGEMPVGTLRVDRDGRRERAVFAYTADWLEQPGAYPLEPQLPLVAGPQHGAARPGGSIFPGAIADTEQDGWGRKVILRDEAKRGRGGAALGHVDFLLAVDDETRMGALRFKDEAGKFQRQAEGGRRTPPLLELKQLLSSTRAVERHEETAADLAFLRGRGTSLGGMRPKCSVIEADGALAIAKFPSVADERAVTKGEVLALTLAKAAGINAAQARLVDSDGLPVALIRRFDRTEGDGRLMYVSAATLLGVDPDADHTYTQMADAIRSHGAAAQTDLFELWRRMAFSVLITNVDDHLRNHGFLREQKGLWRLSPAFDINPSPERKRELKTWLSEETGPAATIEGLLSVRGYFNLPVNEARKILSQVKNAVAIWRAQGRKLGMTRIELDAFAGAFEHEEREAARRAVAERVAMGVRAVNRPGEPSVATTKVSALKSGAPRPRV